MDESIAYIVFISFILIVGLVLVFGCDYLWESKVSCPKFGNNVDMPVKFDYFGGGCFVQLETGQWIDSDNLRGFTDL